jgi:hypothetical protein
MGAIPAIVYILLIIVFIPFPFYKDIVAATSGGGNRDVVLPEVQAETGRLLHKFPHNKVLLAALVSAERLVLTAVTISWHRIYLVFCPCRQLSFSESAMTSWISDGGTKC